MTTFRKGQHLSVGRPGIGRVAIVARCQPLLRTAAVGWPPVQIPDPCFVAPIDYAPSIWRPEGIAAGALLRCELSQRTSREIVNPKHACTRRDADGYMLPIGRQGSITIGPRRSRKRFDLSSPVNPNQALLKLVGTEGGDVRQYARRRNCVCCASGTVVLQDSIGHSYRGVALNLNVSQIEWHGQERSGPVVNQMPRGEEAAGMSATNQDAAFAGIQPKHFDSAFIPSATIESSEHYVFAPRQDLPVAVAVFTLGEVGSGEDLRLAASRGDSQKMDAVGEDNSVVCSPTSSANPGLTHTERRSVGDRSLFHFALSKETDPLAIRREKQAETTLCAGNCFGLGRIQGSHMKL